MKSEEILNNWYESIKEYPKLSFIEAKELALKINNAQYANQKIELRQELILGTLHAVYVYLVSQNLNLFQNGTYDMNDVINSAIESWINIIDSGELLNQNNYLGLFTNQYNQMIVEKMGMTSQEILNNGNKQELSLNDPMVKHTGYNITDKVENKLFVESVLLDTDLNKLERYVINKLYGLNNKNQESYDTLSEKLELKEQYIKHTEKEALRKIRDTIIFLKSQENDNTKTL